MGKMIECETNPNCENLSNCDKKIYCTTAMEQASGLERYICGRTPCKYLKDRKPIDPIIENKQNIPSNGRQITDDIFEITMLDGTVKKF